MALEQHAIPTQVTSYEFRLIGDMTIKQFGWLGLGIIISLLSYSAPLPPFIRWPMVFFFAPFGAIVAFVPFQGRGIDRWILSFIKAIYSPTEFIWQPEHPTPEFLSFKATVSSKKGNKTSKTSKRDETKLQEYIHALPHTRINKVEQDRLKEMDRITNMFSQIKVDEDQITPTPASDDSIPKINKTNNIDSIIQSQQNLNLEETPVITTKSSAGNTSESLDKQTTDISSTASTKTTASMPSLSTQNTKTTTPTIEIKSGAQNTMIEGSIYNHKGEPLSKTLVEIKNQQGQLVRAFKSDSQGKFITHTPLPKGLYAIIIDHPDHQEIIHKVEINPNAAPQILSENKQQITK